MGKNSNVKRQMSKLMSKTIEYGLYLLVFLLPLQTRWIIKAGPTEYLTYSLYGTDILLILLLLLFIFYKFPIKIQNYLIVGLLAIAAVSVFFALDKALALYKFGWLVLGAGLFWLITKAAYSRARLVWSLLIGLGLQAVLGSWQFLAQATFANKWLGLALHRASDLGASVIETMGADGVGERWLRAYGGLDHPNMLGGMLAIGIILILYLSFAGAPDKKSPALRATPLLKGFQILFSAALFFSFSRAAWLALAAGLAAGLLAAIIKKDLRAQRNLLETILVSGLIFFILFFQFPNLVMTRLYSGERLEIKSKSERLESIKNSWPIIKNNWASGVGVGNYTLALGRQRPGEQPYFYQPVHNVFVLAFSEIGIIGMLLFVFLFVRFPGSSPGLKARNNQAMILVALIVVMSLDHWLWSLHFGMLFFWLAIGLAYRDSCG